MTEKIEPWMSDAMKSLHCEEYYTDAMAECDARHVAAHAPKQETQKVRYTRFEMPINAAWETECERIRKHPLYQFGDTICVWVNEGDLCWVGELIQQAEGEKDD